MQEEGIDGVIHPDELQPLRRQRAAVYLGPSRIGLQCAVRHPPRQPLAGEIGPEQPQIDRHQIVGTAVERHAVAPVLLRGAAQLRLVVAGEEALGLRTVPCLIRREVGFKELAGLVCALQPGGGCADRAPVADAPAQRCDIQRLVVGAFPKRRARAPQRLQRGAVVVGIPPRQIVEPDPLAAPAGPVQLARVGERRPA